MFGCLTPGSDCKVSVPTLGSISAPTSTLLLWLSLPIPAKSTIWHSCPVSRRSMLNAVWKVIGPAQWISLRPWSHMVLLHGSSFLTRSTFSWIRPITLWSLSATASPETKLRWRRWRTWLSGFRAALMILWVFCDQPSVKLKYTDLSFFQGTYNGDRRPPSRLLQGCNEYRCRSPTEWKYRLSLATSSYPRAPYHTKLILRNVTIIPK